MAVRRRLKLVIAEAYIQMGDKHNLDEAKSICGQLAEDCSSVDYVPCMASAYLQAGELERCLEVQ